jgi:indole-3-glycerol phosphate synthase
LNLALNTDAEIIGINNRDLHTFKTDLSVTERLSKHLPASTIIVSESGIRTRGDIDRVSRAGAQAVLVGESLITAPDPGKKLRELL